MGVFELITEQQKGHEDSPIFGIGEQLREIAQREPQSAELLEKDLQIKDMTLEEAEKKLREYADKHHGKEKCFCITPMKAEKILREFYGLPEREAKAERAEEEPAEARGIIDLSSFL